jgi:hypothetical protein
MGKETYMMMKSKIRYTTSFWKNILLRIHKLDVTCVGSQIGLVDPNYWIHGVGDSLENNFFSHEQMHIFNIIYSKTNGLHVISSI